MSLNESYPQHVVTAVVVAHDGATWLPRVADALLDQSRPVQRVVAVDTGSRDRSGAVLAAKFGQAAVFGMDRATGYGAAVSRALAHRAANVPVPAAAGISSADRVEWLWFLHDDCEPAPDALEQLLRGAAETSAAAVLGPKLRDWSNREVVLEAGVTVDTAARRVTSIEPREVDQGQHDGDRDTLAVSSAGMLVRRDVWEQVGGFDTSMSLFMEDVDFCWRVHSAGYRVRVITDAICYHAQAATKRKRTISVGRRGRMLDRRNGLITLLGNLPTGQMFTQAAGNLVVSFLRISFFLLAKRMAAAFDEVAAVVAVLGHPLRFASIRRRRARGRRAAYARVHADLPPGRSARRLAEFVASTMLKSGQADTTGAHHASADPTEDDSLLVDNGLGRRLLTSPALLLFVGLLTVALIAGRSLLGGGPLGGGSLVPLWGGASDLWHTYLQAFHPVGIGSTSAAPPYIAVLAGLATLLGGKPWLAVDVLLIGCVPLSGMTALLAVRKVTSSAPIQVWAAASYALLPVVMGVVAAARFGTAVAFILLPLIVVQASRVCTDSVQRGGSGQRAGRAAWATGLLVAIGAAFVPLLWLLALVACCVVAVGLRPYRVATLRNLAIGAFTAPILLLPWALTLISSPAQFALEAGLPQPGTPSAGLPAKAFLLLSPGGPGLPPYWVTAGLLVAALASLFARQRRGPIITGWSIALVGLVVAIAVSRVTVRPADGGPVTGWTGLPLALAAIGLLLAAAAAADSLGGLPRRLPGAAAGSRAQRGGSGAGSIVAWAVGLIACSAPLLAAVSWIATGVSGPVHQVASPLVPEVVAVASAQRGQVRTLVLRSVHGRVSYLLLRGPSPTLADTALNPPAAARQALAKTVADLIAPDGSMATNQSQVLADFDIGYVLLEAPVDQNLAAVLDNVNGLQPYSNSNTSGVYLWQLARSPARVSVVEKNGTVVPIPSGPVGVSGATVPSAGGTLMLAEPAGGWSASVNGQPLAQIRSPAGNWAQAFTLPPGGGQLDISHPGFWYDALLVLQLLAFLTLAGLALPGVYMAEQESQRAVSATADARRVAVSARPGQERSRGAAYVDGDADAEDEDAAADGGSWRRIGSVGALTSRVGRSSGGPGGKRRVGRLATAGRSRSGDARSDDARSDDARSGDARSGDARSGDARSGDTRVGSAGTSRTAAGRSGAGRSDTGETGTGRTGTERMGSRRAGAGLGGSGSGSLAGQAGRVGAAAVGAAAIGLGASAQRSRPGSDQPSAFGGRGDPADRRAARATSAWPYADSSDRDAERSAGRSAGPQARAWPYLEDDDLDASSTVGSFGTQSPGRPYSASEEDERRVGRHAESPGRSPSGRSPSGSVPPSTWSEPPSRTGELDDYDRPVRGTSSPRASAAGSSAPRGNSSDSWPSGPVPSVPGVSPGDRAPGGTASRRDSTARRRGRGDRDGYGDQPGSRDDRAGARGRAGLDRTGSDSADPDWADRDWADEDRADQGHDDQGRADGPGRGWSGLRGGLERRAPDPAPAQRRSAFERAGWRLGGNRGDRPPGRGADSPGADDSGRSYGRSDRSYDRLGLPRGDADDSGQPYESRGLPPRGGDDGYEPDDQRRGRSDSGRHRGAGPGDNRVADYRSGDHRSEGARSGDYRSGGYGSGDYNSGEYRSGEYRTAGRQPAERRSGEHRSDEHRSGEYRTAERQSAERQSGEQWRGEQRRGEFEAQRPTSGRRGRRDSGEPDWRETGSDRVTSAYPDWPDTGDRGLDPLPPRPSAQARPGERRRNVWRPDAGGADARYDEPGYDESGGYRPRGHDQGFDDSSRGRERLRGSTPEYNPDLGQQWLDPEPEYEGDSW